jgi:hypothetical protein
MLASLQTEYTAVLERFKHLAFFAWDRRAPRASVPAAAALVGETEADAAARLQRMVSTARLKAEYDSLSALGRAVPSLREAVAITQDVSEGEKRDRKGATHPGGARPPTSRRPSSPGPVHLSRPGIDLILLLPACARVASSQLRFSGIFRNIRTSGRGEQQRSSRQCSAGHGSRFLGLVPEMVRRR